MTHQSVNLHFFRKAMFYLSYYTESKSFYSFYCCHFTIICFQIIIVCVQCVKYLKLQSDMFIIFKLCSKRKHVLFNIPFVLIKYLMLLSQTRTLSMQQCWCQTSIMILKIDFHLKKIYRLTTTEADQVF